ncbi:MAG: NAD(P)H-binding protein, partial [Desulfobacterales bacterium]|nr:NAD(P)H-binding protein [Desulfobacterales bacterium]
RLEVCVVSKYMDTKMKIAVLGATGFTGSELLRQAIDRQYEIKALARSPEKLQRHREEIEIIKGDYFERESLCEVIQGTDAVISAIGPPETRKSGLTAEDFETALKCLVELMNESGVRRFINLASTGTSYAGESISSGRKILRLALSFVAPLVIPAKEAELKVLQGSNILWTSIRPRLLKRGPRAVLELI